MLLQVLPSDFLARVLIQTEFEILLSAADAGFGSGSYYILLSTTAVGCKVFELFSHNIVHCVRTIHSFYLVFIAPLTFSVNPKYYITWTTLKSYATIEYIDFFIL